ncbi:MAG: TolC family protein [Deltaproteobacteria bacterium]|nr:TolC family protein [Deltaproteobacteria bacterium]
MPRLVAAALVLAFAGATAAADDVAPAPAAPTGAGSFDDEIAHLVGVSGGLTADAAAARAAKVAPSVRRAVADTAGAAAQTRAIALNRIPRADITAKYTRLSGIDSPVIPGFGSFPVILNNYGFDATVGVPLSDYFLRIPQAIDASRAGERAQAIAEQAAAVSAAQDARIAYYEWTRARLQVVVAQRLVAQVTGTVKQVAALVESQRASRADLLRLQAQEAQAQLVLVQAQQGAAIREDQLRILIGAKDEEVLTIGEDVRSSVEHPSIAATDALVQEALGHRLEARSIAAAQEALQLSEKAAKADRLPRASLFASANYDNPNSRIFPSEDKFNLTWAVGAQVTWSPNTYLGVQPTLDGTEAKIRGLDADRDRLADGVRAEIEATRRQVEIAASAIEQGALTLAAAEEGYRVRKELLAAERVTGVELVDAETELTRARIGVIDAGIDLRIALTRLAHARGLDVK